MAPQANDSTSEVSWEKKSRKALMKIFSQNSEVFASCVRALIMRAAFFLCDVTYQPAQRNLAPTREFRIINSKNNNRTSVGLLTLGKVRTFAHFQSGGTLPTVELAFNTQFHI